jgi:general secretion pathway protein H
MTPTSAARNSRQLGFTLLELLVVVSIILIATGLVLPNLNTLDNSAYNAQVKKAVAVLTYARRIAIVEGAPKVATFYALDPESPDYEDLLKQIEGEQAEASWVSELLKIEFQYELNQIPETMDRIEITFFPQGGSTGGVLNFTQNERTTLIRVDPITGRISTAANGEEFDDELR